MEEKKSATSETEPEKEKSEEPGVPNGYVSRRPRTSEDFYRFCTTVLEYENYEAFVQQELRDDSNQSPPLDSSGSSVASESTSSGQKDKQSEDDEDSDSFNVVTCFCGKPFAGRPMIECLHCLTWIHLSCARIKKTHIPEVFLCATCKRKQRTIPSSRGHHHKSGRRSRRSS